MEDIAALRRRVAELEEENREYKRLLYCPPVGPFRVLGMWPKATQVLAVLYRASPNLVTRTRLSYIWDDGDAPPRVVDVYICKLRSKLKPHGVEIRNIWGEGFLLDMENKARLDVVLEQLTRESAA